MIAQVTRQQRLDGSNEGDAVAVADDRTVHPASSVNR
jgi:hypothetical protein